MGTMQPNQKIPHIPKELVEWLERTERKDNTFVQPDLAGVNFQAGKNFIIWLLRAHHDRQNETSVTAV